MNERAARGRTSRASALTAGAAACAIACFASASALSPDARRDLELRPAVVQVSIPLQASIPELGVSCPEGVGVLGSGFLFRPDGYLITNGHVARLANVKDPGARGAREAAIEGCLMLAVQDKFAAQRHQRGQPPMSPAERSKLRSLVNQYLREGKISIENDPATVRVCLDNQQCFTGEIKAYSEPFIDAPNPGKDVAIIKIDGHDLPTVPLGNSDPVNVNDPVYVIGYPGDARVSAISALIATSTSGTISAVKRLDHPDIPVLQTTAIINPGNSGGPAFDARGRVIGIATFKSGSAYNYLVPIDVAMELVRQVGLGPQRGAFDDVWQRALTAYADRRWALARKLLQDVLQMMPHQPDAERLELEAAANARAEGLWGSLIDSFGQAGVAAAVVGLAAVGSGLVWLVAGIRRRRTALGSNTRGVTLKRAPGSQPAAAGTPLGATRLEDFGTLEVISGPLAGKRFPIPKGGLLVGRDPTRCAVVLPIDSVSKEHAWVVPLDDQVVVIDRGSANGTYVNTTESARVDKAPLRSGDRIYLGRSSPSVLAYLQ